MSLLDKIFGNCYKKELKQIDPIVKKLLALLLVLATVLSFVGCGGSAVVLGSLEEKMPNTENGKFIFEVEIHNSTVERLFVEEVEIIQTKGGKETGTNALFGGAELSYLGIPDAPIEPGDTLRFSLSPTGNFEYDGVKITVTMTSESGSKMEHKTVYAWGENSGFENGQVPAAEEENSGNFENAKPDEDGFLVPVYNGNDWIFHIELINNGETPLTLTKVEVCHLNDGVLFGDVFVHSGDELNNLGLGGLVLEPGQGTVWNDGHPIIADFNQAEYRFIFTDAAGNPVEKVFLYKLSTQAPSEASEDDGEYLTPAYNEDSWVFALHLKNEGEADLTLTDLEIRHLNNGVLHGGVFAWSGASLAEIGLDNLVLKPGDVKMWDDGHPITTDFNQMEYRFVFKDPDGNKIEKVFLYKLGLEPPKEDHFIDEERDLKTLRHDASFEVEVFSGVYWVPANSLGESRYTNSEIRAMLSSSPKEKQDKIKNLYEALQLYQIGEFSEGDDNIRIKEGKVDWEHHKPGYDAVRTNTGCCATDSNWLRYILDGDYDEVGYIATSQRDGNGHIFNYIKQDGFYYIIDLTHYRTDWPATAVEDGALTSYYSVDFIAGNIHKTASLEAYAGYIQSAYNDPPGLVFTYTAENCLALDGVRDNDKVTITYENTVPVKVIFDDPNDSLYYAFVDPPKNYPDWSEIPSHNFK